MEEIFEEFEFVAALEAQPVRVDKFLADKFPKYSRTYLQTIIKNGLITVNEKSVRPKYQIKGGELLTVKIPEPQELQAFAENIPIDIIFEDEDIVVVNKASGIVVHPSPGHNSGSLVNALLFHCKNLSGINGVLRPGIVHRLDKDTSGVIVAAKNDMAHRELSRQFKDREVKKTYLAIVNGDVVNDEDIIDLPIGRDPIHPEKMCVRFDSPRNSQTRYKVLERFTKYTFVQANPRTGRTHQIRVHLANLGHPLLGDTMYGPNKRQDEFTTVLPHFALHAKEIKFKHPRSGKEVEFLGNLPEDFSKTLEILRKRL